MQLFPVTARPYDIENVELLDCRPVPEKVGETLFLVLAGGALTDNDVDQSGRRGGGGHARR